MDSLVDDLGEICRMTIACVLITHLPAKVELQRQPHLRDRAVLIVDRSPGRTTVLDHFPAAANVATGMTLEQALSRQADGVVLEADEARYRRVFRRMLAALQQVSDRVEKSELGVAYVALDGLETLHGGEARLVTTLLNAVPAYLSPRAGVGQAKFPAYVAARQAQPLGASQVPSDVAAFLSSQAVELLPIASQARRDMRRLGLHTLGEVAAMPLESLIQRFGREGQRAWELSLGRDDAPLVPLKHEETIAEHTDFPYASASLELLLTAVDSLLQRAYARPQMRGRYAGGADLECLLYRAHPWQKKVRFKQPTGHWQDAARIVRSQLEPDHPQAPAEDLTLALSGITGESGMQLSLLADQRADRERRLAEAERQLQARRRGSPVLYRVAAVAPWHPAPELRAVQVPIGAAESGGMKPLSAPTPALVREGSGGEPAAVQLGEQWHHIARVEDQWCFDLWWLPQPLTRTYYRVGRADGGEVTLFRDQHQNRWFRQDP